MRITLLMLAAVLLTGCVSPEQERMASAEQYLAKRPEIADALRRSILQGKVVLGMFPDEAHAAAGAFAYSVKPDPKWGERYYPPAVIFSQRNNPDASQITMTFCNKTQFDTSEPVSFTVHFEKGKVVRIQRREKDT